MIATGHLGWKPDEFWGATVADLLLAIEGRLGGPVPVPLPRAELDRLLKGMGDG